MDIVLGFLDDHVLDSVWAQLRPLRIPLDSAKIASTSSFKVASAAAAATANSSLWKSMSNNLPSASASIKAAVSSSLAGLAQQSQPALSTATNAYLPTEEWTTISAWPRDDWRRQSLSLFFATLIGIHLMYFIIAGASYKWLFDHRMMQHPRFIKGQIKMEIQSSLAAFPSLTILTLPWFVAEVRGHSACYDRVEDGPWGGGAWGYAYLFASAAFFLWFTDILIYFVHRWEHHPSVYKHIHKPHHRWVIPTPWASHAFHPLDGYFQSLPYHIFIFMFPFHKMLHLGLFLFVNLWTILIHDSDMIVDHPLEKVINGPAHHTLHHLYFTCNYGQYFTWADRYWDSYRHPAKGDDPLLAVLAKSEKLKLQESQAAEVRRQEEELHAAIYAAEGQNHISSDQCRKEQ